ncbi:MAG: MFS transporter [Actinomycetia bacterium]|nr:MFS transporter [Actinomycetes bacterium]
MGQRRGWVLTLTSLGALLSSLNFSTLIIALPDLIRSLHATLLQAVWVLMAYMVAQTVMVLMGGSLADLFGRRRLYLIGLILFTVVSWVAGYSPNATDLIVLRVLQGIGGALVMANSTALVAEVFPRDELGRALGVNVMVVAVGQIVGPVLGGWLTTDFGWAWTFWFNVPFGILAAALGWALFGREAAPVARYRQLDWGGILAYVVAITGLLVALSEGAVNRWTTPLVAVGGAAFVVATPIWLWIERRHPEPLLHLPLFKNRTFGLGSLSAALNAIARMAITFLMIFYFQGAKGDSALVAGLLLSPLAVGMLVMSPVSGWIADRWGAVVPATVGVLLTTAGLVGLAAGTELDTPYWQLAGWMAVAGIGAGFFNSPNTSSMMNAAGPARRGEASGIRALTTNTGMMLSIAFSFVLVTQAIPRPAMLAIFAGTTAGLGAGMATALQHFIQGLHLAFWVMAGVSAVAAVLSGLREEGRRRPNTDLLLAVMMGLEAQRRLRAAETLEGDDLLLARLALALLHQALADRGASPAVAPRADRAPAPRSAEVRISG